MKNVIGQVVSGENFYDRAREQAQFWQALDTDNLLLLAPRRVGKTSLMRRMAETAGQHGYRVAYADVSDCRNQRAFVERLYRIVLQSGDSDTLWKRIAESPLGQTLRRVKSAGGYGFQVQFEAAPADDWAALGEQLAQALHGLEDERWLIQIDELPVFVLRLLESSGRDAVHEFLYWMRRLRLDYAQVRWLLAGSVGLDTVTARLNLADAINDLHIVSLGAFSDDLAEGLLQELAATYGIDLSEAVRRHIVVRCGWPTPYYLHLLFSYVRDRKQPTIDDVERAVEDLLSPNHKGYFDYWRQRLQQELGNPDASHASQLLTAACREPEGASREVLSQVLGAFVTDPSAREEKLGYLLDVLYGDGYLVEQRGRWRFRFPLLREFWVRRVARFV
jgi:hypothetical protein